MNRHTIEVPGTSSPSSTATIVEYVLLALYGLGSAWVGVATLDVVAGATWALLWPGLIALLSTAAAIGVLVSRDGGPKTIELVTTLLLISLLVGYSIAIVLRTMEDGNLARLPFAILPTAVAVHPFSRLIYIARGTAVK
jgi:hypothetical protein